MSKYLNKKGLTNLVSKIKSFVDQKLKDLDIDTGLYAKQSDMEAVQAVIPDDASSTNQLVTNKVTVLSSSETSILPDENVYYKSAEGIKAGHIVQLTIYLLRTTAVKKPGSRLCKLPSIPLPASGARFIALDLDTNNSYHLRLSKSAELFTDTEIPANVYLNDCMVTYISNE